MDKIKFENQNKNISKDIMSEFILNERFDTIGLQKLLTSDIVDDMEKGKLLKYKKYSKNGLIKIKYIKNKIGRLKIQADSLKDNETLTSQTYMWRTSKSVLCSSIYYDLDVVNCHPKILLQIFDDMKLQSPYLYQYVNNRDNFFEECKSMGLSRDLVKLLIMRIFYGGSIDAFIFDNPGITKNNIHKNFYSIYTELLFNRDKLMRTDQLVEYRMEAMNRKDNGNIDGTALSLYLQTIECNILLAMYEFCKNNLGSSSVGALIHDGLHLDRKLADEYGIEALIENIKKCIYNKTKYHVDVKIKNFEGVDELDDIITVNSDKEAGDIISDLLKEDYIMCGDRIFIRIDNIWTENKDKIKRYLTKFIGNQNILMIKEDRDGVKLLPYSKMSKGCRDIEKFVEPTDDRHFINKLWSSNIGKLCFNNGYWDFGLNKLCKYEDNKNLHTTIKIRRNYNQGNINIKQQIYERVLYPIFNNDKDMMTVWLNYISRGMAGHIEDKSWAVNTGERNCGKSVLGGLISDTFESYVRATNSENFLYKNTATDSAKQLSWLVPCEFKRLLITNEITIDSEDKYKINGNILKKLSSGGDEMEARVNHKDEINFKVQSRVCMFANDLPPIEPSDAKETCITFRYKSKFVDSDDKRLNQNSTMKDYTINKDGEIEYLLDENGNNIMKVLTNYHRKDDSIKDWCKKDEVLDAFTDIIFEHYGEVAPLPKEMLDEINDFKDEESDENKFYSLFIFSDDETYNSNDTEYLTVQEIKKIVSMNKLSLSSQKYKIYLEKKGCFKTKKRVSGKSLNIWNRIQRASK